MKLSKKIPLLCALIMALAMLVCAVTLAAETKERFISQQKQMQLETIQDMGERFRETTDINWRQEDSAVVTRSLLRYLFAEEAEEGWALAYNGEVIFSRMDYDPLTYAPEAPDSSRDEGFQPVGEVVELDGRKLLFTSMKVHLGYYGEGCILYKLTDISFVDELAAQYYWRDLLLAAVLTLLGAALCFLAVRRSLAPLGALQTAASRIADGHYRERTNLHSADEVGLLAADFDRMAEAVEAKVAELTETARRQELFIGGVTHEFKTPLTALILTADTLRDTYLEEDERDAALGRIAEQCRALERMVRKLLKLITLGEDIEKSPTPVAELLASVSRTAEAILLERQVELETVCRVETLPLDADLMRSALVNLVDNAAKASRPGQRVLLTAWPEGFAVEDSGIGMSQEDARRAAEPFYMADKARSRRQGGMGLGLALVERIAEAHGGRLEIRSTLGEGTTVKLLLGSKVLESEVSQ